MKDGRLEVSDLMAGDWVDANGHKEIVEQIERYVLTTNDWAYCWKESVIKPILLTNEILEKIGLRKGYAAEYYDQDIYSDEFDTFGLTKGLDGNYVFETYICWCERHSDGSPKDYGISATNVIVGIKYLHELQHALKLCGITLNIEKEIEL